MENAVGKKEVRGRALATTGGGMEWEVVGGCVFFCGGGQKEKVR